MNDIPSPVIAIFLTIVVAFAIWFAVGFIYADQIKESELRDEFAKAALNGYNAHPANDRHAESVAKYCYDLADAMIKERNKNNE